MTCCGQDIYFTFFSLLKKRFKQNCTFFKIIINSNVYQIRLPSCVDVLHIV